MKNAKNSAPTSLAKKQKKPAQTSKNTETSKSDFPLLEMQGLIEEWQVEFSECGESAAGLLGIVEAQVERLIDGGYAQVDVVAIKSAVETYPAESSHQWGMLHQQIAPLIRAIEVKKDGIATSEE